MTLHAREEVSFHFPGRAKVGGVYSRIKCFFRANSYISEQYFSYLFHYVIVFQIGILTKYNDQLQVQGKYHDAGLIRSRVFLHPESLALPNKLRYRDKIIGAIYRHRKW